MATIFAFNMRVDVAVRLGSERAKLKCPEAHNMLLSSDVVRYFPKRPEVRKAFIPKPTDGSYSQLRKDVHGTVIQAGSLEGNDEQHLITWAVGLEWDLLALWDG